MGNRSVMDPRTLGVGSDIPYTHHAAPAPRGDRIVTSQGHAYRIFQQAVRRRNATAAVAAAHPARHPTDRGPLVVALLGR